MAKLLDFIADIGERFASNLRESYIEREAW